MKTSYLDFSFEIDEVIVFISLSVLFLLSILAYQYKIEKNSLKGNNHRQETIRIWIQKTDTKVNSIKNIHAAKERIER